MLHNKKPETKKIWVSGNELVKALHEQEVNDYLYGTGYQSKLSEFIKKREALLKAENEARNKNKVQSVEVEPGM